MVRPATKLPSLPHPEPLPSAAHLDSEEPWLAVAGRARPPAESVADWFWRLEDLQARLFALDGPAFGLWANNGRSIPPHRVSTNLA